MALLIAHTRVARPAYIIELCTQNRCLGGVFTIQKAEYQQLSWQKRAWQGQGRVGCMTVQQGISGCRWCLKRVQLSQCTCNSEELCGPHLALHDELIHGADVVLRWRQGNLLLVGRGDQSVRQRGRPIATGLLGPTTLGLQDMTQLTVDICIACAGLHPRRMPATTLPPRCRKRSA